MQDYHINIFYSDEDGGYIADIPDLEACSAFGNTPEEALRKLMGKLRSRRSGDIASIWVCRANQLQTAKMFAPEIDRMVVNPFAVPNGRIVADPNGRVWRNCHNPFVNQIRQLRLATEGVHLVACINLQGEPSIFGKRKASFEEID